MKKRNKSTKIESLIVLGMAYQAVLKSEDSGMHIERVSQYVSLIAHELSRLPRYKSSLTSEYIADLVRASRLHDIGKIGVPDSILKKTGTLTPEEYDVIKAHCEYGQCILEIVGEKMGTCSFMKLAIQIAHSHHEKWNGAGYPNRLAKDDIPLSARIVALADVYDALRSERYYKKAVSHEETCRIIMQERGEHFAPDIVDAFFNIEGEFKQISLVMACGPGEERFSDELKETGRIQCAVEPCSESAMRGHSSKSII